MPTTPKDQTKTIPKNKFFDCYHIESHLVSVVLPALKPQMFSLESLKDQRNLLPRRIRDWIGKDPQLRENTQQIVEGWDVFGDREILSGMAAGPQASIWRGASMDRRKRGRAKTMVLTFI